MAHKKPMDERVARLTDHRADGCWYWLGATDRDGYGKMKIDGTMRQAHRAIYEHFRGPVPKGQPMHHTCRNRRCVNPDHMRLVTTAENNHLRSEDFRATVSACPKCGASDWYYERREGQRDIRVCHPCKKREMREQYRRRKARKAADVG